MWLYKYLPCVYFALIFIPTVILMVRRGLLPHPFPKKYSGTIITKDYEAMPNSLVIVYENSIQAPTVSSIDQRGFDPALPPDIRFLITKINFGNFWITYGVGSKQIAYQNPPKDLKFAVYIDGVLTKSFGYKKGEEHAWE